MSKSAGNQPKSRRAGDTADKPPSKRWLIAGIVVLTIAIAIATLPARVVYRVLQRQIPELSMRGLSGTIWQGQAEQLSLAGTPVGKLAWRSSVLSLLSFSPSGDFKLESDVPDQQLKIEAHVRYSSDGLQLSRVSANANASWLKPALGIPAINPLGYLAANFSNLELDRNGIPKSAVGNIQWLQAAISGAAQANLGTFDIAISTKARQQIIGNVAPIGASPVSVLGQFQLQQRNFSAQLRIHSASNDPGIARALEFIGQPYCEADAKANERLLKIQGQITLGQAAAAR
jgi:general secretion pathway protein N